MHQPTLYPQQQQQQHHQQQLGPSEQLGPPQQHHQQQPGLAHQQQKQKHQQGEQQQHHCHCPAINSVSTEAMVTSFTLCIQMMFDAVKEMFNNGKAPQEMECRAIAHTCVDSFSFINQGREPTVWETAARRRRAGKEDEAGSSGSSSALGQVSPNNG